MENSNKQLRRQNAVFAGVCGGLGAFFGISPNWFRLVFIVPTLMGGFPGVLLYVILWIVMPRA